VTASRIAALLLKAIAAHSLAATPTAHWLEWADWSSPELAHPVQARDGQVWPGERPGIGIEWDEAAVARFEVR
jgi:mandelate racemase